MSYPVGETAKALVEPSLWLTDEEIRSLMLSACEETDGATESEMEQVVRWAIHTRMQSKFLEMVLSGQLRAKAGPGDDVSFTARKAPP